MPDFDGRDDVLDSREIIERIEELTQEFIDATGGDPAEIMTSDDWASGLSEEDAEELAALIELANEAEYLSDWEYGETLIHEDYFTKYAEELVKDCDVIPENLPYWIADAIDWEKVADSLKPDYTDFEFRGHTYWGRS